jgi:hypothetical protein
MLGLKKKCEFCKQPIEKGGGIRKEVDVYGLVGKFKRSFCSQEHLDKYEKATAELMKTRRPRVCMKCLR